jgi:hypothetical protein
MVIVLSMECLTSAMAIRGFAEALVLDSAEVLVEAGVGDEAGVLVEAVDFGSRVNR